MFKSDALSTITSISDPNHLPDKKPLERQKFKKGVCWMQQQATKTLKLWLILLFCCLGATVQAQLKAKIGYDSLSTCPPMAAQFIDSSLGEPDA